MAARGVELPADVVSQRGERPALGALALSHWHHEASMIGETSHFRGPERSGLMLPVFNLAHGNFLMLRP